MSESARLVDGSGAPTEVEVAGFIGKQSTARWADLTRFIACSFSNGGPREKAVERDDEADERRLAQARAVHREG